MMFCGFCSNQTDKQYQIQIRDPYDINRSQRVSQKNPIQIIQAISKIGGFNSVIPSQFGQYLDQCRLKKKPFIDKEFPPNPSSLNFFINNRKIVWKRIPEVIPNAVMVENGIKSSDVQQGNLGDCYFLACISSLAQVPERITKIFCNQMELRPEGIYRLQLSISGQYREIVIDDFIPVFQGTNRPVFCKSYNNEVWVMLLQKAWAKLSGSYGNTSAGYPHEVLNTFSVAPCFYYEIPLSMSKTMIQKTVLWRFIMQAIQHKMPICAGSRQSYTCKGIKPAHTYSLLNAEQIITDSNQTALILTMRNPWGQSEYMGRCSEHDAMFWSKVKNISRFNAQKNNDGIFSLLFQQFIRNFQCLDICHDRPDFSNFFRKTHAKSFKPVFFELQILQSSPQSFYITVQKVFNRNAYIKKRKVNYGYSRLLVVRKNVEKVEDNKQYVSYQFVAGSMQTNFPDLNQRCNELTPGKYIIMVETQFPNQEQGQLCLYVYNKDVVLQLNKIQQPDKIFLHRVFSDHARRVIPVSSRTSLAEPGSDSKDWTVSPFLYHQGGYGYLFVQLGPNAKQKVQILVNIQKVYESGFLLVQRQVDYSKQGYIDIVVEPNQQSILIFGIDFKRNISQVTFPPRGIKVSKII